MIIEGWVAERKPDAASVDSLTTGNTRLSSSVCSTGGRLHPVGALQRVFQYTFWSRLCRSDDGHARHGGEQYRLVSASEPGQPVWA